MNPPRRMTQGISPLAVRATLLLTLVLAGCGGGDPGDAAAGLVPGGSGGTGTSSSNGSRITEAAADAASAPAASASQPSLAPFAIRREPPGASLPDGGVALFSVEARGLSPRSYQWLRDDEELEGETGPVLRLPVTARDDLARISVEVVAGGQHLRSAPAVLHVARR